jgi:16S rRNA (cytosine1402-N4)-methyltransferase
MSFEHRPVLLEECVRYLNIRSDGTYVDCTVGGAGHASEILKRLGAGGRLLGIDRDEDAVASARQRLSALGAQAVYNIVHSNYLDIEKICIGAGIDGVNGILMDLGVSSHQLDEAGRGFSYMNDAPLDMRMDRNIGLTAETVVNEYPERKLLEIISQYGEERWAARISKFIAERRKSGRIRTTG